MSADDTDTRSQQDDDQRSVNSSTSHNHEAEGHHADPDEQPTADKVWETIETKDESPPWKELTSKEKFSRVFWAIAKVFALLFLLYIFICSLDLLSTSLQLLAGRTTSDLFDNPLLQNPVVGLMIGMLTTVMVQSSSTSTSIIVSMISAGLLEVPTAIPIVMGANVGTSVTNTLVAVTRINVRSEFGRAFAGATVHDMFNWLTVIVLLVIEVTTHYLYILTSAIVDSMHIEASAGEVLFLKVITQPLTNAILMIDNDVLECWAQSNETAWCESDNTTLLKIYCEPGVKCPSLFSILALSDTVTGAIMTVVSLLVLCGCLILLVKLLQNVLQGTMAKVIHKTVNADIPYVPWLTGYLAILVGAVATFLLQSSSVFTSALTPLVGMGIITVARTYPLTLGSNIGTTTTAMLAALTASSSQLNDAIQIALVHLFFNITGIVIFYPLPFMRWPITLARGLGRTTARYRWFAFAYLICAFLLLPIIVLALSVADPRGYVLIGVGTPILFVLLVAIIINLLQNKLPRVLPKVLRDWEWLPLWMHSLDPIDRLLTRSCKCCGKCMKQEENEDEELGVDNPAMDLDLE